MAKKRPKKQASAQKELILVMLISLGLGLGGGYVIGTTQEDDSITENSVVVNNPKDTAQSSHSHSTLYEVPADTAPELEIVVVEDAKSGYNIELKTTNFTFTPGKVNGDNVMNEGHAHIYVDGEKITRAYGKYFHYDSSFEGTKTFSATLNANDHSGYAIDGIEIQASVDVTHNSDAADHDTMHSGTDEEDHEH